MVTHKKREKKNVKDEKITFDKGKPKTLRSKHRSIFPPTLCLNQNQKTYKTLQRQNRKAEINTGEGTAKTKEISKQIKKKTQTHKSHTIRPTFFVLVHGGLQAGLAASPGATGAGAATSAPGTTTTP